jgi:hypothetical protein
MKFARDGFARRDTFEKLYPDWFFHCRVYAKFRESCSHVCVLAPSVITLGIGPSRTGIFRRSRPPKVERVVLNALANNGPTASGQIFITLDRWLRQWREDAERARRKSPA